LSSGGLGRTASAQGRSPAAQTQAKPNVDTRQFLLDTQDWALDDLDMGPFLMNHNFNLMGEAGDMQFGPH